MFDTLTLALILVPCLIIAIVFHEVAHGWVALALGDTTARDMGRFFGPVTWMVEQFYGVSEAVSRLIA